MDEPRRKRRGAVVGAVASLVAAGLVAGALRDEPATPAPAPTPVAATPSPQPTAPEPTEEPATPPPAVRGTTARGLAGRVVLRSGDGTVAVTDLADGRTTAVRVPDRVVRLVPVGGSVALLTERTGEVSGPVYVLSPALRLTRLPVAYAATADATGTGLWLTKVQAGDEVTHHALDGRRLGAPVALPELSYLLGTYDGGFVLTQGETQDVQLWDPVRRRTTSRDSTAQFLASSPRLLAWTDPLCARQCSVEWRALDGPGAGRATGAPPLAYGALSPDDRWLAARNGASGAFVVCDLDGGRCQAPRNATSGLTAFAWSGGTLVAASPETGQLAAWRPGWRDLRLLPGEYPRADDVAPLGG